MRAIAFLAVLLAVPAHAIRVVVTGPSGPLSHAHVLGSAEGEPHDFVTDDSGAVDIGDVAPLCVLAAGHVPTALDASKAQGGILPASLAPGSSVAGTAWSAAERKAVAGVRVSVAGDTGPCARSIVTDASGRYRLDGLGPRSSVTLAIEPPAGWLAEPRRVVPQARGQKGVDVALWQSSQVRVTVLAPGGRPLAGAKVQVKGEWDRVSGELPEPMRKNVDAWSATTGADGRVALPPLPRRASYRVAVTHPDVAPRSQRVPASTPESAASIPTQVGGGIDARAVDDDGKPRRELRVRLAARGVADLDLVPEADPSPAGVLSLRHLPLGTYAVELRAAGARPRLLHGVEVKDGAVAALGDVTLHDGADLAGMVAGDGAPVPGAMVTLKTWADGRKLKEEQETKADGRFRFEGLDPQAPADVSVAAKGWIRRPSQRVQPGPVELGLDLERGGSIEGRVVDAGTGEPVAHFTATHMPVEESPRMGRGSEPAETDGRDGAFTLEAVEPGEHRVTVMAPGWVRRTSEPVKVVAGDDAAHVEIRLDHGLQLEGRVVEAGSGMPMAGATVSLREQDDVLATTDLDGAFVAEGLVGVADLVVRHPEHEQKTLAGIDPSTATQPLRIAMERGGSVAGTVFGADGKPMPGAEVAVTGVGAAVTDAAGAYALQGLPPGSATLVKSDRPGTFAGRETVVVEVRRGAEARHDFGVGTRVSGRVRRGREPAAGAQVTATATASLQGRRLGRADALMRTAYCDEDGRYALTSVAPGAYAILIAFEGRHVGTKLDVPAGATEFPHDFELPDLRLGGLVLDGSTQRPLPGAVVTAMPAAAPTEDGIQVSVMSSNDEEIMTSNAPLSNDTSGPDGHFALLLAAPGKYEVSAMARGYRSAVERPSPLDVKASRDDLVLTLTAGVKLTVRLVDATTGEPISSGMASLGDAHGMSVQGGSSPVVFESVAAGKPMRLAAWATGRAPVQFPERAFDRDEEIEARLSAGGQLALTAPPGAVRMDGPHDGVFALLPASGVDLMGQPDALDPQDLGNGAWIFHHVPAGPLTVRLGKGDAAKTVHVEIREGVTAEADLR